MAPSCKFMELCINSMLSTSVKANVRKIQKILLCFVILYCEMNIKYLLTFISTFASLKPICSL